MNRRSFIKKTGKSVTPSKFCIFVFVTHIFVEQITCSMKGFFKNTKCNLTNLGASQEVPIYEILHFSL